MPLKFCTVKLSTRLTLHPPSWFLVALRSAKVMAKLVANLLYLDKQIGITERG